MNKRIRKKIEKRKNEKRKEAIYAAAKLISKLNPAIISAGFSYLQTSWIIHKHINNK